MSNITFTKEDAAAYRKRVEYEDGLLNTRTNNVLTLNGLAAVAVGLPIPATGRVCAVVVIALVDVLWLLCGIEASRFITALTKKLKDAQDVAPPDERFRWQFLGDRRGLLPPTKYVAIILPALLLVGWLAAVVLAWKFP